MSATTNGSLANGTTAAGRGFGALPCPKCGEDGACITLDLSDLETCHCPECDGDFGLGDVRDLISKWSAVLKWVDAAPALPE